MSTFKQLLKASALAVCSVAVLVSTAQEQVKLGQTITEASLTEFDLIAEPSGMAFRPAAGPRTRQDDF